jgi:hypothetical protein
MAVAVAAAGARCGIGTDSDLMSPRVHVHVIVSGWVAVSMRNLVLFPERYAWLAPYSWRPIGKSMRLCYVPDPASAPAAPASANRPSACCT